MYKIKLTARAKKELHNGMSTIHPIPGMKHILAELKKLHVHMGIVSSNSIDNINKFLENHSLHIFDFIHPTSKIWSKNTSLKNLIIQKGYRLEDILYVGDEIRDIVAAKKLGIKVAAVTWGYNSAQSLKKHKPHYLIENPENLLTLCQKFI